MDKVTIISADRGDARVILDLLRIYYPEITNTNIDSNTTESGENSQMSYLSGKKGCSGNLLTERETFREVVLQIEKKETPVQVGVTLFVEGRRYSRVERTPAETFFEEKKHRERRLLRLALHKLLTEAFPVTPSAWGILTGVRPTKIVHRFLDEGLSEARILGHLTRDYALSPERARLLTQVALLQHPLLCGKNEAKKLISLYISIPFCPTRCHYCSFPAYPMAKWGKLLEAYLVDLCREITAVGQAVQANGLTVQTVYVGGGTPTILSASQLKLLLHTIEATFCFTTAREITVEGGRPDTITREKLQVLQDCRVNRLSINPQTMWEDTLVAVGRKHTVQDVRDAYQLTREAGLPIVNMDLIVGLPGENAAILQKTLEEVIVLKPENVTLHALARKRTAYYSQEKITLPVAAEGQALTDLAHHYLQTAGWIPYYLYRQKESFAHGENVGYTVEGKHCLYNIQMMEERQTILGFGVGASSKFVRAEDWTLENLYNPKDLFYYREHLEEIIARKVDKLRAILYNN